ncbi:MAG: hypothetical protein RLZ07_119 [Pseudomonadota bacterium]
MNFNGIINKNSILLQYLPRTIANFSEDIDLPFHGENTGSSPVGRANDFKGL